MLAVILKGLQLVPAGIAAATEFRDMISEIGKTLGSDDQAALQEAYEDHITDSNEAHERFQARLDALADQD